MLLLAMLMLSAASCVFYRARFAAGRIVPRVGTAGQPLHYRVRSKDLTAKPQASLVFLENLADPRPPFEEWLAFHRLVMPGVFEQWMTHHGKWGSQNKMPRCRSDRLIADGAGLIPNQFAKD